MDSVIMYCDDGKIYYSFEEILEYQDEKQEINKKVLYNLLFILKVNLFTLLNTTSINLFS